MTTGSLHIYRDIILATKKQNMLERQKRTPLEAVLSLAHLQSRPRPLLNVSSDGEKVHIIGVVSRHDIYDPVTSALHCLAAGADAISFFTDHTIYKDDLDDMLMVARGVRKSPVVYHNYTMDEYGVMAARASDASALLLYASLLPQAKLRQVVSMAQRWKMATLVQVNDAAELEFAIGLSPHAICFGDNLSANIKRTVEDLIPIRHELPNYIRVMLMHTLHTLEDVSDALRVPLDGIFVSETLLKNERTARQVREMVADAEARFHNQA